MSDRLSPEQADTLEGVPNPSETTGLFGHEAVADLLASAYQAGRLPHALLLAGPKGIGKATFAFHFAHHLLKFPSRETAPGRLASPDPASALYRQIAQGSHPAILHLTRPFDEKTKKFKTVVSVDEIRRVNRFLSMTSHDGSYRVVIVDAADDMNRNAANALLKNLEEPPSRTVFLLIAHSLGGLLPTIRSRCQTIRLSPLADGPMTDALAAIGQNVGTDAKEVLRRAEGSVRSALLLGVFGGLEVLGMIDRVAAAASMDLGASQRLADAVGGRDQEIRFDLMNAHVLDRVAEAAGLAARSSQAARASGLSRAWQEMRIAIDETEAYNLDRRQHTLNIVMRLHEALRM